MRKQLGILLLDGLEDSVLNEVVRTASKCLGVDVDILGKAPLRSPPDANRGQWRADLVVRQCMGEFSLPKRFCVGLTGMDLYVPSLNFVFGLALEGEGLAIVSWRRLRDGRDLFVSRLSKEVIHETGHLEGLEHCSDNSCVMWFSNTLSETDAKGLDFCPECTRKRR